MKEELNKLIATRTGRPGNYVAALSFPLLYLSSEAFGSSLEADAEQIAGEALVSLGMRGYFTKSDLKAGRVPPTFLGRRFLNSYSPYGGWYVLGLPAPFSVPTASGASHALPYNYDTHVPLAFYGGPFRPGIFREPCEPIDLAVTLAVLLGTNRPSSASGRVLTEALRPESAIQAGSGPTHGKGRQTR